MADKILLRRGNKADLPVLNVGEPGFATDTKELFVGATGANVKMLSVLSGGGKIQSGDGSSNLVANTVGETIITFPAAFINPPKITAGMNTVVGSTYSWVAAQSITATGFSLRFAAGISGQMAFSWIAIGD